MHQFVLLIAEVLTRACFMLNLRKFKSLCHATYFGARFIMEHGVVYLLDFRREAPVKCVGTLLSVGMFNQHISGFIL